MAHLLPKRSTALLGSAANPAGVISFMFASMHSPPISRSYRLHHSLQSVHTTGIAIRAGLQAHANVRSLQETRRSSASVATLQGTRSCRPDQSHNKTPGRPSSAIRMTPSHLKRHADVGVVDLVQSHLKAQQRDHGGAISQTILSRSQHTSARKPHPYSGNCPTCMQQWPDDARSTLSGTIIVFATMCGIVLAICLAVGCSFTIVDARNSYRNADWTWQGVFEGFEHSWRGFWKSTTELCAKIGTRVVGGWDLEQLAGLVVTGEQVAKRPETMEDGEQSAVSAARRDGECGGIHDGVDYLMNGRCSYCELQSKAAQAGLWAILLAFMFDVGIHAVSNARPKDESEGTYKHLSDVELEEMAMKANKELMRRRKRAEHGTWW